MKRPYLPWKRGRTWYYKLPEGKHYLSTGQSTRSAAEQFVIEGGAVPGGPQISFAFRQKQQPY
jgi:hypothetical protein